MVKVQCPPCVCCREAEVIEMPAEAYFEMMRGAHVQNAWPEASADIRELLISGTHPKCWDNIFGE